MCCPRSRRTLRTRARGERRPPWARRRGASSCPLHTGDSPPVSARPARAVLACLPYDHAVSAGVIVSTAPSGASGGRAVAAHDHGGMVDELTALLAGRRLVALTGAGCST